MKINKLSVASFGRINDAEYELSPGLNVIYGPNESGKSTMLSFIRFMLFGCHGRRSANNVTFEEKYQPWYNTAMSGSMEFETFGESYHTSRSVGVRKEYSTINSSGTKSFEGINPGEAIYNMNESAFLRSFYLSANSSSIAAEKNDDILRCLANIADTGDEQMSYNTMCTRINSDKKQTMAQIEECDREILSMKQSSERIGVLKERTRILNEKLYETDSAIQQLSDNLDDKMDRNERYQRTVERYANARLYQQAKAIIAVVLTLLIVVLCVVRMAPVAIPLAVVDLFTLLFVFTGKAKLKKLRNELDSLDQDAKLYSDGVKSDLGKTDEKKSQVLKEIGAIEAELEREYSYEDLSAGVEKLESRKAELNKKLKVLEKAADILNSSYGELKKLFSPLLNKRASEIFGAITGGQYDDVIVSDTFDIRVKGGYDYKPSQMYSSGTYEMMYLSLRLALCDILGADDGLPIFLDDCFALCDDERTKSAVKFLADYAAGGRQVLFCTCHGRELEMFREIGGVNIINLGKGDM